MQCNNIHLKHGALKRLSKAAGVSAPLLSLFFGGRRNIGRRAAIKLEAATGVSAGVWLLCGPQGVLEALAMQGWPDVEPAKGGRKG
jgi:hypothetical protein